MTKHNKTTVGLYATLTFLFVVQAVASQFSLTYSYVGNWGTIFYGAVAVFYGWVTFRFFSKFRAAAKVEVK
jgi:hypothetical protein